MSELHLIISGCIAKDSKSEYALYKTCHGLLLPICLRYKNNRDDALDLLNKGFYKILMGLKSYDNSKSFEHWAKKILIHTIIDEFRKDKNHKEKFQFTDENEELENHSSFDLNLAEFKLESRDVLTAISLLPESQKTVLNLYVFDGFTHEEIAKQLGITTITSRWHLRNARKQLKTKLSDLMGTKKSEQNGN
jgi:RNA polymerase sigma factor (sigma-70 family)